MDLTALTDPLVLISLALVVAAWLAGSYVKRHNEKRGGRKPDRGDSAGPRDN